MSFYQNGAAADPRSNCFRIHDLYLKISIINFVTTATTVFSTTVKRAQTTTSLRELLA